MRGRIIVIEGTDCSGKDTQTSLLTLRLRRENKKIERLSFPMYDTPTGKIIGGSLLGKEYIGPGLFPEKATNVDPKVAALYYAADRRYNIHKINELLEQGYDVILDRYVESNMAHQGGKLRNYEDRLKLYSWLSTLEYELLELPKPDLTILLYMPHQKAMELKRGQYNDEDQMETKRQLRNSEEAYLELAKLHNYITINCVNKNKIRPIEEIHEEVYKIVENYINND